MNELAGEVPIDLFSGEPYGYINHGGDYSLYSVGYDGKDNKGIKQNNPLNEFVWGEF